MYRWGELGSQLRSGTRTPSVTLGQRQVPWASLVYLWDLWPQGSLGVSNAVSAHCPETPPGRAARGGGTAGWGAGPWRTPQGPHQLPRLLWSAWREEQSGKTLRRGCGHLFCRLKAPCPGSRSSSPPRRLDLQPLPHTFHPSSTHLCFFARWLM